MKRIEIHRSVQLAWAIANAEACLSGSLRIEPVHFLLAILKIIDDAFQQEAEELALPPEAIHVIASMGARCRAITGLSDDKITAARRGLHKVLFESGEPGQMRMLHRSEESRDLFQEAARRAIEAGSDELTLVHLLEAIMDSLPRDASPFFEKRQVASLEKPTPPSVKFWGAARELAQEPRSKSRTTKTPTLDAMGRDLTALAREGRLTPVVGRKAEITAIARYLQRTSKRNVILIGEAGVGKTAVVEGLAQRLVSESAPEFLHDLRIVQIGVADLVAGAKYRGDMEKRLQRIIAEATADPDLVLFFDEIHLVIKAGSGGDAPMDVANILKPALARDDFRCIGATTTEEFERHIKSDAAFMRRFQVLRVGEPSEEEALQICIEWARRIERIQQVVFDDEAITTSVALSARLIRGRSLPDKAIDLLENAAVFVKVSSLTFCTTVPTKEPPRIRRQQIEAVLEEQYGISVSASRALDTAKVASVLRAELVGQDEAITALVEALAALGTKKDDAPRPLGVFMFTGPTGVGKTFAAERIGRALFGADGRALGRFNMNEYKERHELARLIGAPPGFVGHEQQGAFFRFAEANPQGLILLDEMEKAHPEIQDYFLQIFDKGEATDSRGRAAHFRRHLFVMTCNVVAAGNTRPKIGFHAGEEKLPADQSKAVDVQLSQHFRREFLARVDRIVVFHSLTADDHRILLDRRLVALVEQVERQHETRLEITEAAKQHLCALCADQDEGARGFIRLLERIFVAALFDHIKTGPKQGVIRVGWAGSRPVFS